MTDDHRPEPVFDGEAPLGGGFPAPSVDQWREAAAASLKGRPLEKLVAHTHEGLGIEPLYTADDLPATAAGYPGLPPYTRGSRPLGLAGDGWQVCVHAAELVPERAAGALAEALSRGAGAAWLTVDGSVRLGLDPDHERAGDVAGDGLLVATADDLAVVADAAPPARTPVHLDGGGAAVAVAALWLAAARRRGHSPAALHGSLGCDPLGALAADGELAFGLERSFALLPGLVRWTAATAPGVRPLTVSTLPYHMAGASAVHELALTLASGAELLRTLTGADLDLATACRSLRVVTAIGRDLFMEAAKLRALRQLWARLVEAAGGDAVAQQVPVHAVTSPREVSRRDPWVNLLRGTLGGFAAIVGGADAVTVLPFDGTAGEPGELGRRMAVNTHTILREESHLAKAADPAGGSYYVERLTAELAAAGWEAFQRLEAGGGMRAAFRAEHGVGELLATALGARRRAAATRRDPVTGVSTWPNLAEKPLPDRRPDVRAALAAASERLADHRRHHDAGAELTRLEALAATAPAAPDWVEAAIEAAAAGASIGELTAALAAGARRNRIVPLPAERTADGFERLRDASDRWLARHGARPRIFLANLGPIAEHTARATFARNLFEAGGIEALDNDGFATPAAVAEAFAATGTSMAVICGTDARYVAEVPEVAAGLKERGATVVVVAGKPGEHEARWRAAGVDRFVFLGCDVLASLRELLQEAEVLS